MFIDISNSDLIKSGEHLFLMSVHFAPFTENTLSTNAVVAGILKIKEISVQILGIAVFWKMVCHISLVPICVFCDDL